jgi:TRAP transporter TAXI family solute receptor
MPNRMAKAVLAFGFATLVALLDLPAVAAEATAPPLGRTVTPGATGWSVRRPVMAAACAFTCPWGELGDFTVEAMKPLGYEVILCRNCNRIEGPRIVGRHSRPPPIGPQDLAIGTAERVDAPVDFGVTESTILAAAYRGERGFARDGAYKNLRLIAKIEDPNYLLVAVRKGAGVTDLAQIRDRKLPVRVLIVGSLAPQVLDYYGLTPAALAAWGGSTAEAIHVPRDAAFDVIVSDLGSAANNIESNVWASFSQTQDLIFLDIPAPLLDKLSQQQGVERVTARPGFLRGIDRPIPTVGRSGHAVFARDDTPDQAAYDLARAIDARRGQLKWYIRPFSYDPRTVTQNLGVPLHPGAARYYREVGYGGSETAQARR